MWTVFCHVNFKITSSINVMYSVTSFGNHHHHDSFTGLYLVMMGKPMTLK